MRCFVSLELMHDRDKAVCYHAYEGNLVISGAVQQVTDAGVTSAAGTYRPTT